MSNTEFEPSENSYNPENPNFYLFKPKTYLNSNLDKINLYNYNTINVCAYEVNNYGKYPFLKYLLVKNMFDDLSFLNIELDLQYEKLNDLIKYIKKNLYEIFLLDDFDNFSEKISINGFYEYKNEFFICIDLTECNINIDDRYSNNYTWFAIIDELLNCKNICNLKIDKYVSNFFNNNYDFCLLLDSNNEAYEIPIVGFVGKQENKLNFTYIFGETPKDNNSILGPYYYFTDFNNAVNDSYNCSKHLVNNKCGIVRFALFTGTTKYIENFVSDNYDSSEIKQERLNDELINKNKEQLTIRISDHDGKWSEQADSCYLGKITLDNGLLLENTPLIVLKEYKQQIPLSYHYLDKASFFHKTNKNLYHII
jgi:hypothetical protein